MRSKNKNDLKPFFNIGFKVNPRGFGVDVFKSGKYQVDYPLPIFKHFPKSAKAFLIDNFVYARTRPLTLYGDYQLRYQTAKPALRNFIDQGILKDLACIGDLNNLSVKKLTTDFQKLPMQKVIFNKKRPTAVLPKFAVSKKKAVLAISFGKDSLLSYGLSKELGLDLLLVSGNETENYSGSEWKFKKEIINKFSREQKQKVHLFYDNVDEIFYHPALKKELEEADDTNSMLAYALEILPFVYFYRAKYLILGNERNLNDFYLTKDGFKAYPSYDQSTAYTQKENQCWQKITNNGFRVISLLEPLYNLAEMKILYSRYPHLLKYLMSCSPAKDDNERWCYDCSMCAKAFLYAAAVGGDPQKVFFNRNFFEKKYQELYPLFASKIERHYEKPPPVRDEQLLSFLLAYRYGWRGPLIDLFKTKYLKEAVGRENILRRKFFGLHRAVNLPEEFQNKVLRIYRQELKGLC